MSIEWTTPQMIVSTLGERFVRSVLINMPQNSTVRFGETGEGIFPNYQVEDGNGAARLWRGNGHGEWPDGVAEFDAGKVSIAFTKTELSEIFYANFRTARQR